LSAELTVGSKQRLHLQVKCLSARTLVSCPSTMLRPSNAFVLYTLTVR
ncbi:PREDICTED: uncharacterized protein LOC108975983, partial [Bactrocera latifrons]